MATQTFKQTSFQHENCQEESEDHLSPGQPYHRPGKAACKGAKKGKYIAIKCHNTPGDNDSGSYEINLPYYGGGTPED